MDFITFKKDICSFTSLNFKRKFVTEFSKVEKFCNVWVTENLDHFILYSALGE